MSPNDKIRTDFNPAATSRPTDRVANDFSDLQIQFLQSRIDQLETILNQVDAYIYTKDRVGRYTYANQHVLNLFGKTLEEVIGHEDRQFFDLTLSDDLVFNDSCVIGLGQTIRREERNVIKSTGETRIYWTVKQPIYSATGEIIGELGISTDITERKLAEEMWHFHSTVLHSLPVGICLVRASDERIIFSNPEFECRFGYGSEELLEQPLRLIAMYTVSGPLAIAILAKELERTGIWTGEVFGSKKDGTVFWCVATLSVYQHPVHGKTWALALINITAHKQIEDMLRVTSQRLSLATRTAGIGIWEWDVVQDKLIWDDQMLTLYGLSRHDFRGNYNNWSERIHPEDLSRVEKEIHLTLRGETDFNTEFRVCRKDGSVRHIYAIAAIKQDVFGRPVCMVGTNWDITSLRETYDSMLLANSIYQASGEAIMVIDEYKMIKQVNPAFTRLTGYELSEVIDRIPQILNAEFHDKSFYQAIWRSLRKKKYWQGEIRDRHRDGTMHTRWLSINVIFRSSGQIYGYIVQFSDITEKKNSEELILMQTNFDQLTMLPNRFLFKDRLDQEMRKAHRNVQSLALIYLDLDHFKDINDTLGHAAGDHLLKEVGKRIKACVRDTDTVARLGGDEFAIILPNIEFKHGVEKIARHIIQELNVPFHILTDQADYHISTSIGIAFYPQDGHDVDSMMKHADQAMYAAKQAGRDRFCYFTPLLQQKADEKMILTNDLRKALERNEMQVYYQPILDLNDKRIIKAEALLRWHHPQRGVISPQVFIPLAEENGLIMEIGEWVFNQSLKHIQQWINQSGVMIQVSINKSPIQFREHDEPRWHNKLVAVNLPGNCINVEITEGLLLRSSQTVQNFLLEFRNKGIEVSIDDFGTGFSSLSYLKEFDIDYIKIDRSFISNLSSNATDRALVEAIIVMAHKLDIKTIAEGVETEEQQNLLHGFGCDYVQGFLYSPPVPTIEFEKMLLSVAQ